MFKMPAAKQRGELNFALHYNPDWLAELARAASMRGEVCRAATFAARSIESRAYWFNLNGKWIRR